VGVPNVNIDGRENCKIAVIILCVMRKFIRNSTMFILHDFRSPPNGGSQTRKSPSEEVYRRLPVRTLVTWEPHDSLLREWNSQLFAILSALAVNSKKILKGPASEEIMIAALTQLSGSPLQAIPIKIANAGQSVAPGSSAKTVYTFRREGRNDFD
jgi:hypothetical protein